MARQAPGEAIEHAEQESQGPRMDRRIPKRGGGSESVLLKVRQQTTHCHSVNQIPNASMKAKLTEKLTPILNKEDFLLNGGNTALCHRIRRTSRTQRWQTSLYLKTSSIFHTA